MKRILFYSLVLSALILSSCSDKKYSYEEYGLNRPVKSVKVMVYDADSKFGEVVKGDIKWSGHYSAEFNSVGNIEVLTGFDKRGDIDAVTKYKYNDDDNIIDQSLYDDNGTLEKTITFEYDGGYLSKVIYKRATWSGTKGYVTEYKREGKTLKEVIWYKDGEMRSVTKYSKDDKTGADWVEYDESGDELSRGSYTLNKDGKIIRYNFFTDNLCEVSYNEKGLPIYLKNADLSNNTFVEFNPYGNSILYVEYEYDDKGNWIKQTLFKGESKRPYRISERTIVY